MKVVINRCHGGFGISQKAMERYAELKGFKLITQVYRNFSLHYRDSSDSDDNLIYDHYLDRNDPALVRAVEELGTKANGAHAELKIVDVPDDVDWYIDDYDGLEWVAETHRTWE